MSYRCFIKTGHCQAMSQKSWGLCTVLQICIMLSVPQPLTASLYKVKVRLGCKKHIGPKQRYLDDRLAHACRTIDISILSIIRSDRYINVSTGSPNVPLSHVRRNVTHPNPNPFEAIHTSALECATHAGTTSGDPLVRLHVLNASSG